MLSIYGREGQSLAIEEMVFGLGVAETEPAPSDARGAGRSLTTVDEVERQQSPSQVSSDGGASADTGGVAEDAVERAAGEVARALVAVIRDSLKPTVGAHALGERVERQEEALKATVEGLMEMKGRIERLSEAMSEQQSMNAAAAGKYEQLAAVNASLQEADKRREAELASLRQESTNLSSSVADKIQALLSRLEIQEQEVSEVRTTVSDISPRVAAVVQKLERQAQAIRSLCQAHSEPQNAADRLIEALVQWKGLLVSAQAADQEPL